LLPGLGSRRSKPLMPERNEPVIVTVRILNDLSERLVSQDQTKRRPKQLAPFSWVSLHLFEVIDSLPLFEVIAHFDNHETTQFGPDSA
jgi:hypothetical protein